MGFDSDDEPAERSEYYAACPPSPHAWLYIAVDVRDMGIAKIGLTTKRTPEMRIAEGRTYNPFLVLFTTYDLARCTWGTSAKELADIERYIHRRAVFGTPIGHLATGRSSEWFRIHPEQAESIVDAMLAKRGFSVGERYLYSSYDGPDVFDQIRVSRMREIKTVYRPSLRAVIDDSINAGIPDEYYREYYNFLRAYHSRPQAERPYD
ncbi:GIY-YIG nuclease family protein [Pseudomonas sp. E141]|jgi:hypothetical protein|uniref:GIY-YIG nuclease family protein n=1 Tax=Pseudomonas TaxID=286 RepID=UPI00064048F9|nr:MULTISPECIES: GIY-YIG nuclease family protein [Pseudomonas]MDD2033190.1 GIY-YIG nuclease family protein [Pseudomonas sp. 39167]MEA1031054.1 GIY-YIG nuclease family protein [Pseudomonas sp. N-137]QKJ37675.1 GIY-YIG nuclease family protein [Pseudomonas sp. MPDS]SIS16078.1 T5orf172 domain-containing protein [Pseudomonas sp. A214]